MIGDPVALTIRRNIERPSAPLLDAFQRAPTGFVTDAYNGKGCMHYVVKPLTPDMYPWRRLSRWRPSSTW
jgi:hypothetical protein